MSQDSSLPQTNGYFLDPESAAEMARLINLDRLTTRGMGGPLAGLPGTVALSHVLDIACGPGGWVLDVAFAHPESEVAGIDVSTTMIHYANARARSQQIGNASFGLMDATHPLDFADNSFDLVNGRFLIGFLTRANWPPLLREGLRVLRPGGIVRLTETDALGITSSPAFQRYCDLTTALYASYADGRSFSADGKTYGIIPMLEPLLTDAGFVEIQRKDHSVDFSAGKESWAEICEANVVVFTLLKDALISKHLITQQAFEDLLMRMHIEIRSDDFQGRWNYTTVWATKPL